MLDQIQIFYTDSQLPVSDKCLYVDPEYPEVYPPIFVSLTWQTDPKATFTDPYSAASNRPILI